MLAYMLDTDISSYIMKQSNDAVRQRSEQVPVNETCISAITKSELMYGVQVSPRQQQDGRALAIYLRYMRVLDYGDAAASHYAEIRAFLKKTGAMIGANDLLLAAHARSLGLVLVTNNVREFGRVPDLVLENWVEG